VLYLEVSRSKFLAQKDDCERSRWLCAAVARKEDPLRMRWSSLVQIGCTSFFIAVHKQVTVTKRLFLHAGLPGDRPSQLACYDWALIEAYALWTVL